jgi:hypothetical protein
MFRQITQVWHGRARSSQWLVIMVAAVMAAAITYRTAALADARADQAVASWGQTTLVAVAASDLALGHQLGPEDTRMREVPATLLPSRALTEAPRGQLRAAISAGTILTEAHLSGSASGLGALLGPSTRAVAVRVDPTTPSVSAGELIELVVTEVYATSYDSKPQVIGGTVLSSSAEQLVVAVGENEAARAATASAAGLVAIVVRPPSALP